MSLSRDGRRAVLRIAGSIAAFSIIFMLLPVGDLLAAVRRIPPGVWPLAIGSYLVMHMLGVAKWRMVVNVADAGLTMSGAIKAYYWGLFSNTFLPSIIGGDVVKVATAFRSARSRSGLVMGSLVDRLLDTAGLVFVAGIGATLSPRMLDAQSRRIFTGVAVLGVIAAVFTAAILYLTPVHRLPYSIRKKLVRIRTAVHATAGRPDVLLAALVTGMVLQTLLIILNQWLGTVMGLDIPLYVWLFVWPLAKISALLPVTQGGIGVREAALAVLFAPFGVSATEAVASGLAFTAIVVAGGMIAGLVLFISGSRLARQDTMSAGRSNA